MFRHFQGNSQCSTCDFVKKNIFFKLDFFFFYTEHFLYFAIKINMF